MSSQPKVVRVTGPGLESSPSVAMAALRMPRPAPQRTAGGKGRRWGKRACLPPPGHSPDPCVLGAVRDRSPDEWAGGGFLVWWLTPPRAKPFSEKRPQALPSSSKFSAQQTFPKAPHAPAAPTERTHTTAAGFLVYGLCVLIMTGKQVATLAPRR